jgi:hypothetical protein
MLLLWFGKRGEAKGMHCLGLSDGWVTSVVGEMCDPMCAHVLFSELPKLSLAQRDEIHIPFLSHGLAEA